MTSSHDQFYRNTWILSGLFAMSINVEIQAKRLIFFYIGEQIFFLFLVAEI